MAKKDPIIDFSKCIKEGEIIDMIYPIDGLVDVEPNMYAVTDTGRIFSLSRYQYNKTIHELKLGENKDGYLQVPLKGLTRSRSIFRVHKLVALTFVPNPYGKPEIDHLDNDRKNNKASNLAWATRAEQMQHVSLNSLNTEKAIAVANDLKEAIYTGLSMNQIAKKNGVSINFVRHIKYNNSYTDITNCTREDFYVQRYLSADTIIAIYENAKNGMSDKENAKLNCRSIDTIQSIRRAQPPYNMTLGPNRPPILLEKSEKLSREDALSIYNDCKSGMRRIDVASKWGIGISLVTDVRLCRGCYEYLQTEYGLAPLDYDDNKALDLNTALEINKRSKKESVTDLCYEYRQSNSTITDIKFCRGPYTKLIELGGTPAELTRELPPPRFNREEAIAILRDYKATHMSETFLARKYHTSRHTIHAIITCTGQYAYLKDEQI